MSQGSEIFMVKNMQNEAALVILRRTLPRLKASLIMFAIGTIAILFAAFVFGYAHGTTGISGVKLPIFILAACGAISWMCGAIGISGFIRQQHI